MTDRKLPATVDDLINMLDEAFPERCPSPQMSDRAIWMAAGSREVVRLLLALRADRDETLLDPQR